MARTHPTTRSRGRSEGAMTDAVSIARRRLPPVGGAQDDPVELVVRKLNVICKAATLEFALAVGKLIVDGFFGGDISRCRSRDPRKDVSLRKLARHPDLPLSRSALYRSIAIYELCERLSIRRWRHVSTSHIRLVLPLPTDAQERLLRLAEVNGWTVRQLDEEIGGTARDAPSGVQRAVSRRPSGLGVAAKRLSDCVDAMAHSIDGSQEEIEASPESVKAAAESLQRAVEFVKTFEVAIATKKGGLL
jgi:hypothetical protein